MKILAAGASVNLREMQRSDAKEVVDWRNLDVNAKWLVQWEPLTVDSHLAWFDQPQRKSEICFIFESKAKGPFGTCALSNFDRNRRTAEWGRLCSASPEQNALLIIEGCYLSLRFAFEILGLERVYGGCAAENTSVLHFNEFLGFVAEGRRRRHLATPRGYLDVIEMGLFPEEFDSKKGTVEKLFYRNGKIPHFTPEASELRDQVKVR